MPDAFQQRLTIWPLTQAVCWLWRKFQGHDYNFPTRVSVGIPTFWVTSKHHLTSLSLLQCPPWRRKGPKTETETQRLQGYKSLNNRRASPRHEENNACNRATPAGPADREHPDDKGPGQFNGLGIVLPLLSMHTDVTDLTTVGRKPPLLSV